jgi:hypothetical protein
MLRTIVLHGHATSGVDSIRSNHRRAVYPEGKLAAAWFEERKLHRGPAPNMAIIVFATTSYGQYRQIILEMTEQS